MAKIIEEDMEERALYLMLKRKLKTKTDKRFFELWWAVAGRKKYKETIKTND